MRLPRLILIILSLFVAVTLAAASGTIQGLVIDKDTRLPLPFVNVALRKNHDSTIVTGQVTDSTGKFLIAGLPAGDYYLTGQMIGYKPNKTRLVKIDGTQSLVDVGKIALEAGALLLDEVQVSAEKLLYTTSIDRKVYNVEKDLMSKAGSASELLQNVPSVQVDIDGNVSLRGFRQRAHHAEWPHVAADESQQRHGARADARQFHRAHRGHHQSDR
jgi:hypothetical protein